CILSGDPVHSAHGKLRSDEQPLGDRRRQRDVRDTVRHPGPAAVRDADPHRTRRGGTRVRRVAGECVSAPLSPLLFPPARPPPPLGGAGRRPLWGPSPFCSPEPSPSPVARSSPAPAT